MTKVLIAAAARDMDGALRLNKEFGGTLVEVDIHKFPDGESLVRAPAAAETVIVYNTLDHPDEKLITLGLISSAFRGLGVKRLVLVAPYLCYMRQDKAFRKGEVVAQRFIGGLLEQWFDRLITVEPHLHRVEALADVMPGIESCALSAAGLLAAWIKKDGAACNALLVGPDAESESWTSAVATVAGVPFMTLEKARSSDRDVVVSARDIRTIAGKQVYLVDDIVSTGATLATAARLLTEHGAARIDALIVHALFSEKDGENIRQAGVKTIRSTDTVTHPTNAAAIAPLLAKALEQERSI